MGESSLAHVCVALMMMIIIPIVSSSNDSTTSAQFNMISMDDYDLYVIRNTSPTNQSLVLYSSISTTTTTQAPSSSRTIPIHVNSNKFLSGATNARNNTVYLGGDNGTIAYLNTWTGEQGVLIQLNYTTKITSLTYLNNSNTLCWIANNNVLDCSLLLTINSSSSSSSSAIHNHTYSVVNASNNPHGMVVGMSGDTATGTLYYTVWPHLSPQSLYKYNMTTNTSTQLATNLYQPHSLVAKPRSEAVYYVQHPPGINVFINKLDLMTNEHSTVIKLPHKRVRSLAMACFTGDLFWSDGASRKVLWRVSLGNTQSSSSSNTLVEELGRGVVTVFARECSDTELQRLEQVDEVHMLQGDDDDDDEDSVINPTTTTHSPPPPPPTTTTAALRFVHPTTGIMTETTTLRLCSPEEMESIGCDQICIWMMNNKPMCLTQLVVNHPHHQEYSNSSPEEELIITQSSKSSTTTTDHQNTVVYNNEWPPYVIALVSVLSTVCTLMTLITVYLTIRVRKLSKKPLIRRRVVVSRSASESDRGGPTNVREMIDIENCCNMNVCETPCYERTLLQPATTSSSSSSSTVISVNSSNSTWGGTPCPTAALNLNNSLTNSSSNKKEDKRCLLR